ncbi:putative ribosomal protein [Phyllosticta citriasiana]|uniref:Ribosomal protein n=1 Tax=Phyllosticta citriasiana TaxID=595635 RepID=A0ABR1L362_9PEZI
MAAPTYHRSPFGALKRVKISPPRAPCRRQYNTILESLRVSGVKWEEAAKQEGIKDPPRIDPIDATEEEKKSLEVIRPPRNVEAIFKTPLRRQATYGIPVCDLQLRTYSVRNIEFFADFALRAAYYLGLPAKGPVPLPKLIERWTVPRSNFIFKKSQENFERITIRRLIQIQDGDPEVVQIWLSYLQKHQYYGVGMKANIFEFEKLDVATAMDEAVVQEKSLVEESMKGFGRRKDAPESLEEVLEMMHTEPFKSAAHGNAPMSKTSKEMGM